MEQDLECLRMRFICGFVAAAQNFVPSKQKTVCEKRPVMGVRDFYVIERKVFAGKKRTQLKVNLRC